MNRETIELQTLEANTDRAARELDRLSMALLDWPSKTVVAAFLPPGTWAIFPKDWHTQRQMKVYLLQGIPPWRGPDICGVSVDTARRMVQLLKGGYRGSDRE